jgi:hypothetical protein
MLFDESGQLTLLDQRADLAMAAAFTMVMMVMMMMIVVVVSVRVMVFVFVFVFVIVCMRVHPFFVTRIMSLMVPMLLVRRTRMDAEMHPRYIASRAACKMHVKIAQPNLRQLPLERRRLHPEIA